MVASMKTAIFNCQCDQMKNCEGGCETIYRNLPVCEPNYLILILVYPADICRFQYHYTSNRAPMVVVLESAWVENDVMRNSTRTFLDYIQTQKVCARTGLRLLCTEVFSFPRLL